MSHSRRDCLFEFESSDSLAQFSVWMTPIAGGGVIAIVFWGMGGLKGLAAMVAICIALLIGLRTSITVRSDHVIIRRKWFFIPYRSHTAPSIERVCFGGDYGLEEGAMGVVVTMGGKDFHLGTSKSMHYLYEALTQFVQGSKN